MVLADIGIAKPQLIGEDNFIDIFIIRLRRGSVQAKPVENMPNSMNAVLR
jgi:hypothetical protein